MEPFVRLAVVVSHPIQYYVPLYRQLAARDDLRIRIFFTWHAAETAKHDPGFGRDVAWDIPLTDGYDHELVENTAAKPGSRHFWGIRNPELIPRVIQWKPDAVHITGYAYASHLNGMRAFHRRGIPVLFRGDSHLLDQKRDWPWQIKKALLQRVYGWTSACLYVGRNNFEYYRELGVPSEKLFYCPHSIEVERFAEPNDELERQAREWRSELGILPDEKVLLFSGKFESRKQPIELMKAVSAINCDQVVVLMVGNGPLDAQVRSMAKEKSKQFRILPFQNQSKMPIVYRLADLFVLPSRYGETWGLAMNEAIASGRRVIASDKVGGASDLIRSQREGAIFKSGDWNDFATRLSQLLTIESHPNDLRGTAQRFDISETERTLCETLKTILHGKRSK